MELGIIAGLTIILVLEITRHFRTAKKNNQDIEELKNRVSSLEKLFKK